MSDTLPPRRRPVLPHLRAGGAVLAAACAARGLYEFQVTGREDYGWWLLAAALVVGAVAQAGLRFDAPAPAPPPGPAGPWRRGIGIVIALGGAALWETATARIYYSWTTGFDFAWMGWTGAVILIGIGLDLAWGRWPRSADSGWRIGVLMAMAVVLAVAAVYRLGNIADFPGEAAVTQIEDLQVGNFGWAYLNGYRLRWEYLSSTWLAALGIWLGGPSQFAMRVPFAVVSALKVLPLFVWLRRSVGTVGALTGTALLACSFWDVVLSRIPNNHNTLIVSIVFALLAGPVRRGRPSAYALLGFFGGYVLHEYIAYRPLAVFAVAGAVLWSLLDRTAGWPARLVRPLITAALLGSMVMPLFLTRIPGPLRIEYFDGWNRARSITGYYNPTDTWQQSLQRRLDRAYSAAELFVVRGDRSPVRNVASQPPLIDPVTCALLVLGLAGAAANLLRPVFGLTVLGFLVTVSGTLVFTGNFDVARVGGAVPYVYALAGFGAAGLWAVWGNAWGRAGKAAAALLLAVTVAGAGVWSTRHLFELWTSPVIRAAHRNNLAYLTVWLRDHVHPGERVLGIAPGYENVLEGHDGAWLRGGTVSGFVTIDIETALRQWEHEAGPTLLFVFAGESTPGVTQFLTWLLPELEFQLDPDPLHMQADVASVRLPGPPPDLAERLAEWHCRGARAAFSLVGASPGDVMFEIKTTVPFISKSTWPALLIQTLYRLTTHPSRIHMVYTAPFRVTTPGDYLFALATYVGNGTLTIDGQPRDGAGHIAVPLDANLHTMELVADFAPMAFEPNIALFWSGPDTGNRQELMPLYRLTPVDPSCAASAGQAPFALGASHPRHYLTAWLGIGPFDNANGSGVARDFIDVPALSTAPPPAAAPGWHRIEPTDAFVNLDRFLGAPEAEHGPEWQCAYAVTSIRSPDARDAYLELAGSEAALRVWLNGRELSVGPLVIGYEPLHRPIALRAGQNALVVKSCKSVGSWYFIASITDAQGADLADLESAAALPAVPIPLAPPDPIPDVQVVEGFAEIVGGPHSQPDYPDHRGASPSWWAYLEDGKPEVAWRTPPVPERKRTIVAVTTSISLESGEAELSINGHPAISFPIGTRALGGMWETNGFEVTLLPRGLFEGNTAVMVVSIPAEAVTPGQPLDLSVRVASGASHAWFMVKGYPDTAAYEHLTPATVQAILHGEWQRARAPTAGP